MKTNEKKSLVSCVIVFGWDIEQLSMVYSRIWGKVWWWHLMYLTGWSWDTDTHTHSIMLTESIRCEKRRKIKEKSGIHRRRESKAEGWWPWQMSKEGETEFILTSSVSGHSASKDLQWNSGSKPVARIHIYCRVRDKILSEYIGF